MRLIVKYIIVLKFLEIVSLLLTLMNSKTIFAISTNPTGCARSATVSDSKKEVDRSRIQILPLLFNLLKILIYLFTLYLVDWTQLMDLNMRFHINIMT